MTTAVPPSPYLDNEHFVVAVQRFIVIGRGQDVDIGPGDPHPHFARGTAGKRDDDVRRATQEIAGAHRSGIASARRAADDDAGHGCRGAAHRKCTDERPRLAGMGENAQERPRRPPEGEHVGPHAHREKRQRG